MVLVMFDWLYEADCTSRILPQVLRYECGEIKALGGLFNGSRYLIEHMAAMENNALSSIQKVNMARMLRNRDVSHSLKHIDFTNRQQSPFSWDT